ncbi:hypothetical protein [Hydrogenophaga sp.]|uniref:hypothetical protein n=1 Tax=Hydrogenophaga sp. TaxID=1904254 RepID=UPI00272FCE47|nr:hypothetical protein [Hydrogenophaga sp.]MDP2015821.1 hypothetical protein [Hydrogenophaga sp.]MDP3167500.1 hypothetical protein [Hydrogenophaga sp.]MDP3810668.1 hypothetical protein [Hydrogenophaga sp.]
MTYRGERSRELATEQGRVFEVSKIRLAADGHVLDVLWGEVNSASGLDVGAEAQASAAEVIDAIHDGAKVLALFEASELPLRRRQFVIVLQQEGGEHLAFEGPPVHGCELVDLSRIEPPDTSSAGHGFAVSHPHYTTRPPIHAVSKVRLDADGRITGVLWGTVDPTRNDWATPEVVAPVGQAVDALLAGHQVFALFPSTNGHLPDRQFVVADYDGANTTIVLDGPAAYEREVHDMDRLAATG